MWWKRKKTPVNRVYSPVNYPSGSVVETEEATYFIKGNTKYKVFSPRVLDSWRFDVLPGSEESVRLFKTGAPLGFRNGTLIKNIADSKIYIIEDNKKRHIVSPDVFEKFGFDRSKVIEVSQKEVDLHEQSKEVLN